MHLLKRTVFVRYLHLFLIFQLGLTTVLLGEAGEHVPEPAEPRKAGASLHERLERLDLEIRLQSARIAGIDAGGEDAINLLQRFRDLLEGLDLEIAKHPDAVVLGDKLSGLESMVSDLKRAARGSDPWTLPPGLQLSSPRLHLGPIFKKRPKNDACAQALPIEMGDTVSGDTGPASSDGQASCGASLHAADVWFKYVAEENSTVAVDTLGSAYDTVLSVHTACPGAIEDQIRCNDDVFGLQSALSFSATEGREYWIRVSGFAESTGAFRLRLGPGTEISGHVTAAATGEPLSGGRIEVRDAGGSAYRHVATDDEGAFAVGGLSPGSYFLTTDGFVDFLDELYDDLPCPRGDCEVTAGSPIEAGSQGVVRDVSFALDRGGAVAGKVIDVSTGEPLPDVRVEIVDATGNSVARQPTDRDGRFRIGGLSAGTYFARTRSTEHADQVYDGVSCSDNGCDPRNGTPILIEPPLTQGIIDFALDRFGTVSGTVTGATTGAPLADVQVVVLSSEGHQVRDDSTDAAGRYRIGGLRPATYFIKTGSYEHADEVYDDVLCPENVDSECDPANGIPVEVGFNTTSEGLDFALERLGSVSGSVTDVATGRPVSDVSVEILNTRGHSVTSTATDESGRYIVSSLLPGAYLAMARSLEYEDELYRDVPCADGLRADCTPRDGWSVEVFLDTTTAGVDFTLERLGAITGLVRSWSGEPLSGITVEASDGYGQEHAWTDDEGRYQFLGLEAGNYFVRTASSLSHFLDEIFDDIPCPFDCDPTVGAPVDVARNSTSAGIDFVLDRKGVISGTVTDNKTGEPVESIYVAVWDTQGSGGSQGNTDSHGHYEVSGLMPGTYFVTTRNEQGFLSQLYEGLPCFVDCDPLSGMPVEVVANATTTGVDFALDTGGAISGTVTDARTGEPIVSSRVSVLDAGGFVVASEWIDSSGQYTVEGLPPGVYFVTVENHGSFLDELYDGLHCPNGCDLTAGVALTINLGETLTGIDFELERFGAISGRVTDARTGDPVRTQVGIWSTEGGSVASGYSDATGRYTVGGLPPGTYFAVIQSGDGFLGQIYDGAPCPYECSPSNGIPIEVTAGSTVSGIDFTLGRLGAIAATVVDAATGEPIAGISVRIWNAAGERVSYAGTDDFGVAVVGDLPPGTYFAATSDHHGYLDELYDGLPCRAVTDCAPTKGTPITISSNTITQVRFTLAPAS